MLSIKVLSFRNFTLSPLLIPHDGYSSAPVQDAVFNLVFFYRQILAVFSNELTFSRYAWRALSYLRCQRQGIFLDLYLPVSDSAKLHCAAIVVPNHKTLFISCQTVLILTLYAWLSLAIPPLFYNFGPVRGVCSIIGTPWNS